MKADSVCTPAVVVLQLANLLGNRPANSVHSTQSRMESKPLAMVHYVEVSFQAGQSTKCMNCLRVASTFKMPLGGTAIIEPYG